MNDNLKWQRWDDTGVAEEIDCRWSEDIGGYENIHRSILARLVQSYLMSPMEKVLEIGCGSGLIYGKLVPEIVVNSSYLGLDNSNKMLDIARQRYPTGQFFYGDAHELPFPSQSFEVGLCFEVLGHLPNIQQPIKELFRVTSRLIIFTAWISQEAQTIISKEEILGKLFLHKLYTQEEIIKAIQQAAKSESYRIEIRVLSDVCWAFVILKEPNQKSNTQEIRSEILPFQGLTDSFIKQHFEIKTDLKHNREELLKANASILDLQKNFERVQGKLTRYEAEIEQAKITLSQKETELKQTQDSLFQNKTELKQTQDALFQRGIEFHELRNKGNMLSLELDQFRNRKIVKSVNRLFCRIDARNDISPSFQQLKDDSALFIAKLKSYRLQPSINLQRVLFLQYPLNLDRPNLKGVLLAPILDLPLTLGTLGVEIVSPSNQIVCQSFISAPEINASIPSRFDFSIVTNSDQGRFWLRVFARDVDGPIRIFEWRKYSGFGFGPVQTRGFNGFIFKND